MEVVDLFRYCTPTVKDVPGLCGREVKLHPVTWGRYDGTAVARNYMQG